MGNRRQQRLTASLPVRVWGTDCLGKPFVELIHSVDISRGGARLAGISVLLNVEDVVAMQHKEVQARAKVVWVGRPDSSRDKEIGVRFVEVDKDLFGVGHGDEDYIDKYREKTKLDAPKARKESRKQKRHSLQGGVLMKTLGNSDGSKAALADMSRLGCYLSTLTPLPVNTSVELELDTGDHKIGMGGVVRTCHPHVGMAVQFTSYRSAEDKTRFDEMYSRLEMPSSAGEVFFPSRPAPSELPPGMSPLSTSALTAAGAQSISAYGVTPPAKPDSTMVGERLASITQELLEIEQLVISCSVRPEVLTEFREAIGKVRQTSWALQRWMELNSTQQNPFPVLSYLNSERIKLATRLCTALTESVQQKDVYVQRKHLKDLLSSVEDLFTRLAEMDLNSQRDDTATGDNKSK